MFVPLPHWQIAIIAQVGVASFKRVLLDIKQKLFTRHLSTKASFDVASVIVASVAIEVSAMTINSSGQLSQSDLYINMTSVTIHL